MKRPQAVANRQKGVSLIELIIFMVIVGVAMAGIISSINFNVQHSADPLVKKQALAISEALMEEVMLQNFSDPDGVQTGETDRSNWDDIDDYNNYSRSGMSSVNSPSVTIAGLEKYTINIAVDSTVNLNGISGGKAKRITVSVDGPLNTQVILQSYRTDYGT
jgi:MSHA pilin protein MshD